MRGYGAATRAPSGGADQQDRRKGADRAVLLFAGAFAAWRRGWRKKTRVALPHHAVHADDHGVTTRAPPFVGRPAGLAAVAYACYPERRPDADFAPRAKIKKECVGLIGPSRYKMIIIVCTRGCAHWRGSVETDAVTLALAQRPGVRSAQIAVCRRTRPP